MNKPKIWALPPAIKESDKLGHPQQSDQNGQIVSMKKTQTFNYWLRAQGTKANQTTLPDDQAGLNH